MTILALVASALVGYAFYACDCTTLHTSISTAIFAILLVLSWGISFKQYPRTSTLIRITSFILLLAALAIDIILIALNVSNPTFIITNGLLAVVAALICYSIYQSKQ